MRTPIDALVETLHARFSTDEDASDSGTAAAAAAAQLFAVAADVACSLPAAERRAQADALLGRLSRSVGGTARRVEETAGSRHREGECDSTTTTATTATATAAAAAEDCSPVLVCAAGAAVLQCCRRRRHPAGGSGAPTRLGAAEETVPGDDDDDDAISAGDAEALAGRFEAAALQLLSAHPPFSPAVVAAAAYAAAHLALAGRCGGVVRAAVAALRESDESAMAPAAAVEALAHVAALLAGRCPAKLTVPPPTLHAGGADPSGGGAAAAAGRQRRGAGKGKKESGKKEEQAGAAESESEGAAAVERAGRCYRVEGEAAAEEVDPAVAAHLTSTLVECCLDTLQGAEAATGPATGGGEHSATVLTSSPCSSSVAPHTEQQHRRPRSRDATASALLVRRVLIPLLLMMAGTANDNDASRHSNTSPATPEQQASPPLSLATYEPRVRALLASLASSGASGDCEEAVVLVAALFDFLFRFPDLQPATDYRYSPLLWSAVSAALANSIDQSEVDAGQRANQQLRAVYLLKRIVHLTHEQEKQHNTDNNRSRGVALPPHVPFHPLFAWHGEGRSAAAWELFFLVLETLDEFGWHIIQPAMTKLDVLTRQLAEGLAAAAAATETQQQEEAEKEERERRGGGGGGEPGAADALSPLATRFCVMHPLWIELLLLKMLTHPNMGVRKIGLRRAWALPTAVLAAFSPRFLYDRMLRAAADPRLCVDLDRTPVSASFLETKAFEGREMKAVPNLEPLALEVENFYARLFTQQLRTAAARRDAFLLMMSILHDKPARFTVTVWARAVHSVLRALAPPPPPPPRSGAEEGAANTTIVNHADPTDSNNNNNTNNIHTQDDEWTSPRLQQRIGAPKAVDSDSDSTTSDEHHGDGSGNHSSGGAGGNNDDASSHCYDRDAAIGWMLSPEVLAALTSVMREAVQENIPYWLDVRITAVLFSALLHAAAHDPARFRANRGFWRLLCMCGPLGQSGGRSIALMDACGQVGSPGGSVDESFLQARVVAMAAQEPWAPRDLVPRLVCAESLLARTEALLRHRTFSETEVKMHFFLVGALLHDTASDASGGALSSSSSPSPHNTSAGDNNKTIVASVAKLVGDTVASFRARAYLPTGVMANALASLAQLHRTLGTAACAALFCVPQLEAMASALHTLALTAIDAALDDVAQGQPYDFMHPGVTAAIASVIAGADGGNNSSSSGTSTDATDAAAVGAEKGGAEDLPRDAAAAKAAAVWGMHHTSVWDTLAAALHSVYAIALHHTTAAAEELHASEVVLRLVALSAECAANFSTAHAAITASTHRHPAPESEAGQQRDSHPELLAHVMLARNTSRLLQSALCGLSQRPAGAHRGGEKGGRGAGSHESPSGSDEAAEEDDGGLSYGSPCSALSLHAHAGSTPSAPSPARSTFSFPPVEEVELDCFLGNLDSPHAAALVEQLSGAITQRLTGGNGGGNDGSSDGGLASHNPFSALSWTTLLSQHARYIYNAIFILCQRIDPAASPRAVRLVRDFGLTQVEQCWTSNLACVYDLLCWAAAAAANTTSTTAGAAKPPALSDEEVVELAEVMLAHVEDVGARQQVRLSAMAFSALHAAARRDPDFVRRTLLRLLHADDLDNASGTHRRKNGSSGTTIEPDRSVYLASVVASLEVLRDAAAMLPAMIDVLLYVAVLFNNSRDEEENESTMAATEPLLAAWPPELRVVYPPTVRLSAVGRALAVSTLLWCCTQDAALAQSLSLRLLRMNSSHPVLTHEPCMPNSRTHRARIRAWQLTCALLPLLAGDGPTAATDAAGEEDGASGAAAGGRGELFAEVVLRCLPRNNLGSVRRFMELYAIRLLQLQPALYTTLAEAMGDYSLRPQVCGSYILVASHALLENETATAGGAAEPRLQGLFDALFPRLLQQSTSNQHLLRIISHVGLYRVCRAREERRRPIEPSVRALYDYVARAPEHVKLREKHDCMLFFDAAAAATPRSLFCIQRKEASSLLCESVPAAAFERMRFVDTEVCCLIGAAFPVERLRVRRWVGRDVSTPRLLRRLRGLRCIPHTAQRADYYVDYTTEATEVLTSDPMLASDTRGARKEGAAAAAGDGDEGAAEDDAAAGAGADIQKKVTSWWQTEVYNELHPRSLRAARQPLVIVGSLLENPVNIAGLCRCAEIFAVERVVVPEAKVFEHPHFMAVARSAELWTPWEAVPPRDLLAYLQAMRGAGYAIVGVEQTAHSVPMASHAFARRTVAVLGAEGQGIPGALLPLLDVCVEIPQYGLIRSLNVHVTGALVMYEYTRQRRMVDTVGAADVDVGSGEGGEAATQTTTAATAAEAAAAISFSA